LKETSDDAACNFNKIKGGAGWGTRVAVLCIRGGRSGKVSTFKRRKLGGVGFVLFSCRSSVFLIGVEQTGNPGA